MNRQREVPTEQLSTAAEMRCELGGEHRCLVDCHYLGGVTYVSLIGRLDAAHAGALRRCLDHLFELVGRRGVVCCLEGCELVGEQAARVLAVLRELGDEHGPTVVLSRPSPGVVAALERCWGEAIFPIYDQLENAWQHLADRELLHRPESAEVETRLLPRLNDIILIDGKSDDDFRVHFEIRDEVPYMMLKGALTGAVRENAMERIDAHFSKVGRRGVVLDLSECTRLYSTELGLLIAMADSAEAHGGKLILLRPSDYVMQVFSALGLDSYLEIAADHQVARWFLDQHGLLHRARG